MDCDKATPELTPAVLAPETINASQLQVPVTLQRGRNGPQKTCDVYFGVNEGATVNRLIAKAMENVSENARSLR
ncbi:hypothetical protein AAVH_19510, partial [Aphelenchoides avenae]